MAATTHRHRTAAAVRRSSTKDTSIICRRAARQEAVRLDEHLIQFRRRIPTPARRSTSAAGAANGDDPAQTVGIRRFPRGDHIDYLVDGHLHHPHADHCDDGPVKVKA